MATIMLIVIGVISLLVKQNKIKACGILLVGGGKRTLDVFFLPKKPEMSAGRWCPRVGGCHNSFLVFVSNFRYFSLLKPFESGGHF
jgi:hypothetical protein